MFLIPTLCSICLFSKANRKGLPELHDFWNPPETYFDTILTAEERKLLDESVRNEKEGKLISLEELEHVRNKSR